MSEKQVYLELVSSYTLDYNDKLMEVKKYDTVPSRLLKRRDWGIGVGREWYMNEDLFPCFEDLKYNYKEITFKVYTLDDKGVRNGKAQCVIWTEFGNDSAPYVKWDAVYKDGKLHGAYKEYDVKLVSKMVGKSFYVNGRAVDAKTAAEWRKMQSAINVGIKSKQSKKR